jgi:hypothetical protein
MDKVERDGSKTRCALYLANVNDPTDLALHEGAAIEERSIDEFLTGRERVGCLQGRP